MACFYMAVYHDCYSFLYKHYISLFFHLYLALLHFSVTVKPAIVEAELASKDVQPYMFGQQHQLTCTSYGLSVPVITWLWQPCNSHKKWVTISLCSLSSFIHGLCPSILKNLNFFGVILVFQVWSNLFPGFPGFNVQCPCNQLLWCDPMFKVGFHSGTSVLYHCMLAATLKEYRFSSLLTLDTSFFHYKMCTLTDLAIVQTMTH